MRAPNPRPFLLCVLWPLGCYQGLVTSDPNGASDSGGEGNADGSGSGSGGSSGGGEGGGEGDPSEEVSRIELHRLTRSEYEYTLADLFGGEFGPADFVRGGTGVGFANQADLLRDISDDLAKGYITHAADVASAVVADPVMLGRVATCTPAVAEADDACLRATISSFGLRAWRRPLDDDEIAGLAGRYVNARNLGSSHTEALHDLLRMFLGSPNFIFHIEIDPDPTDPTPHPLGGYELANRLSYTLWNSMPDDELFELAGNGDILDDDVLEAQIDRVFDDSRADRFRASFLDAWLHLPLLDSRASLVDTDVNPTWDPELGVDMKTEMVAFLEEFTRSDLPWSEFLTADVNFVTPRLAEHYGMSLPPGSTGVVRVEDHPDQRVGFLGLAGFLTYTSRTEGTSPPFRGKIILEALQCTELEVPPGVPPLEEPEPGDTEFPSIRERFEKHREDPSCSGCHNLLDPLGFGLENFDGIGAWRDAYEDGHVIDASVDYKGQNVEGLLGIAPLVALDKTFTRCPSEKVVSYALRRQAGKDNRDLVVRLSDEWGTGSIRELVKLIVMSDAFRSRRGIAGDEGG